MHWTNADTWAVVFGAAVGHVLHRLHLILSAGKCDKNRFSRED